MAGLRRIRGMSLVRRGGRSGFRVGGLSAASFGTPIVDLDFSRSDLITLNGSTISQINGASGTVYNFAQATAINQPTWSASDASFNGRGSATFSASHMLASTAAIAGGDNDTTLYLVYKPSSVASLMIMLESSSSASANPGAIQATIFTGAAFQAVAGGAAGFDEERQTVTDVAGTKYRKGVVYPFSTLSTAAPKIYLSGSLASTTSVTATGTNTTSSAQTFYLGARSGVSFPYSGTIARVLLYRGAHTAVTVAAVDAWLAGLYG